jgi:neutral ceramidase
MAVADAALKISPRADADICYSRVQYAVPARWITDSELAWAEDVLSQTDGVVESAADGVGDDYKALLYKELRADQENDIPVEQVCFAVGDIAFISYPGEMFTEIGMRIKAGSPFAHTCILGLANGYNGYLPTVEAIAQGGYEVDMRRADDSAEKIIVEQSLVLLGEVYDS